MDWSEEEVAATVASYMGMLNLELRGQPFNKSAENRKLLSRLDGRTKAAVEYKYQNISAVLVKLGWLPIVGYLPAANYQRRLGDAVESALARDPGIAAATEILLARRDTEPCPALGAVDVIDAPSFALDVSEWRPRENGIKRDYLLRDSRNRNLGLAGELSVVAHERSRLLRLGRADLARRIVHTSLVEGDGLGFDVLSYEESGEERRIEVKTTLYPSKLPFFVSQNEVMASAHYGDSFHLYRLFHFRSRRPGMYMLSGSLASHCDLRPVQYLASPMS